MENNNNNQAPNNVIQFPGRKKEAEAKPDNAAPTAKAKKTSKKSKKNMGATVVAITLMTIAVNKYTFETKAQSADLASNSAGGRTIASVERVNWPRDAQWEKQLAEKLASANVRTVASTGIGRAATKEEQLRWGILEEKYTILYNGDERKINAITLQDSISSPAYILDRNKFLREYGHLFEGSFESAKLKSVETSDDKTVEHYTIYDKDNQPKGEARFELDRHKRLLSLKVEPIQI